VDRQWVPMAGQRRSAHTLPGHVRPLRCGQRTWQWTAVAVVGLAMAGGGCGGCGCGCGRDSGMGRASPEEIAQVRENLRKKAEQEKKEAAERKKRQDEEKARREKQAAAEQAKKQAKRQALAKKVKPEVERPKRPEQIAEWKEEDYFTARAEGDPRLVEAVALLGRRQSDREDAARVLTRLLQPDRPTATAKGRAKLTPQQTEAILAALAANGTAPARTALEQVVTGKLALDDKTAVQAAVEALARHPAPETEAILYRALTGAAGAPAGQGKRASAFESMVLAAVPPESTEEFRVRLAGHVVDRGTDDSVRRRLEELLAQPCVENLAAQVVIFREFETPAETKAGLEQLFTVYGSETVRRLLGVPEQAIDGSSSPRSHRHRAWRVPTAAQARQAVAADPALPGRVTAHLWNRGFADHLAERLYHLDSLDQQAELICLAGTIPVDSLRSSVYATLARNWQDGPAGLESAGLPARVLTDPGLILSVKTLPHESLDEESGRKPTHARASVHDVHDARRHREKIMDDWAGFGEELVLATCRRLELAARARAAGGHAAGDGAPSVRLPLKLHESARVVARYRTTWPEDLRSRVPAASVDPLEINYVHVEARGSTRTRSSRWKSSRSRRGIRPSRLCFPFVGRIFNPSPTKAD